MNLRAPRLSDLHRLWRDTTGAAAVEMALWAPFLIIPIFSVVDIGDYAQRRMQVEASGQAAVSRVWSYCSTSTTLPVVTNCSNLAAAMTTAAQATTLGATVTLTGTTEGYYCVSSTGALTLTGTVGTFGTAPTGQNNNCPAVGGVVGRPSRYIRTTATHNYTPIVGLSVTSLLPSPITKDVWMRLS